VATTKEEAALLPDTQLQDPSSGKDITYKTAGDYTLVSVPWAKGASLSFNDTAASTLSTVGNAALFLGGLYLLTGFPAANAVTNPFQFSRRLGVATPELARSNPRFQHRTGQGSHQGGDNSKGEKSRHGAKMLLDESVIEEETIKQEDEVMEREKMVKEDKITKKLKQNKRPVSKSIQNKSEHKVRSKPQVAPRRSSQKPSSIPVRSQPQAVSRQSVRPPNRVRFTLPSLSLPTLRMPGLPSLGGGPPVLGSLRIRNPFSRRPGLAPGFRPRPNTQSVSLPRPNTVRSTTTVSPVPQAPLTTVTTIQRVPVVNTHNFVPVPSPGFPSRPSPQIPSFSQESVSPVSPVSPVLPNVSPSLDIAPVRPENFNTGDFSPFDSGSDPFDEFQAGSFGPGQDSFRDLISNQFGSSFDSQRLPSHR